MLKKIRNKRGFTLVEVLVAFVIFAIMAAMVGTILQTTLHTKQQNTDTAEQIQSQKEAYYQKEQPVSKEDYSNLKSSPDHYTNTVSLDFGNSREISMAYVAADPTGEGEVYELEYYIGEYGNDMWKKTVTNQEKTGNGGDLFDGLDCGIYGSAGMEHVTVALAERPGHTNQYYVFVGVEASSSFNTELSSFSQLRMKFPSTILKYGYINKNGQDDGNGSKSNGAVELAVYGDLQTLRISGDGGDVSSSWGTGKSIYTLGSQTACCWVELAVPLTSEQLNDVTKIFGNSGKADVVQDTVNSLALSPSISLHRTKFSQFVSSDEEPQTYVNVFAATEIEVENPSSESTGEA